MKITEEVRRYAEQQNLAQDQAIQHGLEAKAREFTKTGAEIYSKA